MNINQAFPSKWLKATDIPEDADLVLTIRTVTIQAVGTGEQEDHKPVVHFDEVEKGLVLNKTNADTIAKLYTAETENWVGKRIALFATEVDFAGKQTLAIRVRLRPPAGRPQPAQPAGPFAPALTGAERATYEQLDELSFYVEKLPIPQQQLDAQLAKHGAASLQDVSRATADYFLKALRKRAEEKGLKYEPSPPPPYQDGATAAPGTDWDIPF
jgi:hypothetical protein